MRREVAAVVSKPRDFKEMIYRFRVQNEGGFDEFEVAGGERLSEEVYNVSQSVHRHILRLKSS